MDEMTALWRKQILPFGAIPRRDRELSFTPEYLADMAAAFTARVLEVVPLSRGHAWGFSDDPDFFRGIVRSLEVADDGMDAVVGAGAELDALLEADPHIPAGARLIERYRTTDGREFPVVLAGLYLTRAPVLTGLRPWTREPALGGAHGKA